MDSDYERVESDGDFRAESDVSDISLSEGEIDLDEEPLRKASPADPVLSSPISTRASRANRSCTLTILLLVGWNNSI